MKKCNQCQSSFEVNDDDRIFYEKISPIIAGRKYSIPEPDLCPDCRMQQRMIWRVELDLFKRKSDLSGKNILSYFPPESNYTVYAEDEWWSDAWNPLDYGRDFDFSRPFFDQFSELLGEVPLIARTVINNENCDYINAAGWSKNCYMIAAAGNDEDCYYSNYINNCKSCVDCNFVDACELCYECIDCINCYNLAFSQGCDNCNDSYFLFNCKNSKNCFGSVNLVNREYVFMNEQLTKESYETKLASLQLHQNSRVKEAKVFFQKHRLNFPHRPMLGHTNENVTGNALYESRNSFNCFDSSELEDCKNVIWMQKAKNCMDIYAYGFGAEECYSSTEVGDDTRRALFSVWLAKSYDILYSYNLHNSKNCFGSISLRNKQYCILNKQYSKQDYEALVSKIIEHMKRTGEWGKFFPMAISPFAYNQSIVKDNYPIPKEAALSLGAKWNDEKTIQPPDLKIELADSIYDISQDICNQILTCESCQRPYKIISQEFNFYKDRNLPAPRNCFNCRHLFRIRARNPRKLYERVCANCSKAIQTTYSPERPEKVYCEQCYLVELY